MEHPDKRSQERRQDAQTMKEILAKLEKIEAHLSKQGTDTAPPPVAATTPDTTAMSPEAQVLLVKLSQLTLKRHAVLTATLGEQSYHDIAATMKCSETTTKLHLKAAMNTLGIANRNMLLSQHKAMLSEIPDHIYRTRFGISKTWYTEDIATSLPHLHEMLTNTRPAANQHTESP